LKDPRALGLSVLAFFLMLSYSVARPAVESLFLAAHGSADLPMAWLVTALLLPLVVAAYNQALRHLEVMKLYAMACGVSALLLILILIAHAVAVPYAVFVLYAWKELYVVVLVEVYYTYANLVFPIPTARRLYGIFGMIAAVGSMTGNLLVGRLAEGFGTAQALLAVPVLLAVGAALAMGLSRRAGAPAPAAEAERPPGLREALRVVRASRYLLLIVAVVALSQLVSALVDYHFNATVELALPDLDARTAMVGKVYAVVSAATIVLHAATAPILRLTGIPRMLVVIPGALALALAYVWLLPGLMSAAAIKITGKCLDYSLFRNAKEMLYIPLDDLGKSLGKSIVDVFTYRLAKVAASLVLLALVALGATSIVTPLIGLTIGAWVLAASALAMAFRRRVSRQEEMAPSPSSCDEETAA
jgi:ATP:ADP antiporter, AAA family